MNENTIPSWPKFAQEKPRVLLLTSQYFLMGEVVAACEKLGLEFRFLDLASKEMNLDDFVNTLLGTLTSFRPDFVLTVNHLGVDREGFLTSLLDKFEVPLVSWFVDNPLLVLPAYDNLLAGRNAVFSWDADNLDDLRAMCFENVFHLPLGTDPDRFVPGKGGQDEWRSRVSFVGNSMIRKTSLRLQAAQPTPKLMTKALEMAEAFGHSDERSVRRFIAAEYPDLQDEFNALDDEMRRLAFETFITWQSTLLYRLECLTGTLPFEPLIVGDEGWKVLLNGVEGWRYHPELAYYDQLPDFYPMSDVNFNCTSLQMKGAVNQRVFDVPAAGAFLITDHRRQMEELFDPGTEVVTYDTPDEVTDTLQRWLRDPEGRQAVASAARKRVLAEHTYAHRLQTLVDTVRQTFA